MRAGALDAMSIGYRTLLDEIDRTTNVRKLLKVDLREAALNNFATLDAFKKIISDAKRIYVLLTKRVVKMLDEFVVYPVDVKKAWYTQFQRYQKISRHFLVIEDRYLSGG